MIHRHAFEALDKTLRDVMQNNMLFGGKVFLLGGDFRQILPVVRKGCRVDIVDASLCRSYIWESIKVMHPTENMRVVNYCTNVIERDFVKWTLDIGNGDISDEGLQNNVALPLCMRLPQNSLQALIGYIYGELQTLSSYASFFKDRAIWPPHNKEMDAVNNLAMQQMPGTSKEYVSADLVCESDCDSVLLTTEFLNSLDLGGGFLPHVLQLKHNVPIMLLRNLDPKNGLCNGTCLIFKQFHNKVIDADIITGSHVGTFLFIPRIDFFMGAREETRKGNGLLTERFGFLTILSCSCAKVSFLVDTHKIRASDRAWNPYTYQRTASP
ncbi:hypothetical protein L7F22_038343 [Adiantum nelumboides]|nr:hypothetical protein [Adiantum nelumboides]